MSNKVKLILIVLEVVVLLVLFLLGAACQQRWIIITGNGPRIDWYDDDDESGAEPGTEPIVGHSPVPELSETTEPVVTTPPATTEPEETTEETTEATVTETEPGFVPPPDDWETDEF